jgi:tetratricopeptide (TPR) repeat protein
MSLLLEALKKAEKAKEEAQRRAHEDRPSREPEELRGEEAPAEASAEPQAGVRAAPAAPVLMRRDSLPEISQKLEILTDDLLDKPAAAPERARVELPPEPAPRASAPPPLRDEARAEAGRASARKVFEAKFREPNPRMPFYITMGCLSAFALGTVIYFYIELRPPPALVNTNPPRQAEQQVAAVDPARPAPGAEASTNPSAIPGLPGSAPASTPSVPRAASAAAPSAAVAATTPPVAAVPAQPRLAPRLSTPPPMSAVESPRAAPSVHPKVDSGYTAYLAGNLDAARADYQQALSDDPANRDAQLGLAALDVRTGRLEAAESAYVKLVQADPRDAEAQAALIALRGGRGDPLAAESRLKTMLAADPKAHALNFALGNQFAQQGRWAEAQAQYFKAFAAEPNNPDFAYNLAVSLDHLRQPKQALEYYKHAVELARVRGASFDPASAEARIAQLSR